MPLRPGWVTMQSSYMAGIGEEMKRATTRIFTSLLVLCLAVPARATIILFIYSPQGIAIGADSKKHNPATGTPGQALKLVVLQNRVAVASMELMDFHLDDRLAGLVHPFDYEFQSWISNIGKTLPPNIRVSQLAGIVADKSKSMLGEFNSLMASGRVRREDFPMGILLRFFVAGFENNLVRIYEIDYPIDWEAWRINGPVAKLLADSIWGYVVPSGLTTTSEVFKGSGKLFDEAAALYPVGIRKLVDDKKALTISEAVGAIGALMRIEAKYVPQAVGPPYTLVIIPPRGAAKSRTLISKRVVARTITN
jgi:hypothetical protein